MDYKLIIVTAPSGAGKTTIVRHLLKEIEELAFSVSATTRTPRSHEVDGLDYFFKRTEEFKQLIQDEAFVEWEQVYENQYYGTLYSEVERIWNNEKHIIFDIDVKGAVNLKNKFPDRTLSIFISPPSAQILFERLRNRNTEDEKSLRKRIGRAKKELTYESYFDRVLVNDQLEVALEEAEQMVRSFIVPQKV